jgi:hypothetical protein
MSQSTIQHHDTLRKARVKGAADYMKYRYIPFTHIDLFRFNNVSKHRGWAMLKEDNELFDRRHHNNEVVPEKRGRPPTVFFRRKTWKDATAFFRISDGPQGR